jgi:transcriptional regulator with XRE-family HTH domain
LSTYRAAGEALGVRLRQLRLDAGLTGEQLAERLSGLPGRGWSQSKVSRIEAGRVARADPDDIAAWARACGASTAEVDELLARLAAVKAEYSAWRLRLGAGIRSMQLDHMELEARTTWLRAFETIVVPGLLQTHEYARYRMEDARVLYGSPDDVADALQGRMARQQVLYQPDKRFQFLMLENAIRQRLCPPEVLRGQLGHLLTVSTLPNVELGIVPVDAEVETAPAHGFWIFDDELVLVETIAAELMLREPEEIALYARVFEALHRAARLGDAARAIVQRVLQDTTSGG